MCDFWQKKPFLFPHKNENVLTLRIDTTMTVIVLYMLTTIIVICYGSFIKVIFWW